MGSPHVHRMLTFLHYRRVGKRPRGYRTRSPSRNHKKVLSHNYHHRAEIESIERQPVGRKIWVPEQSLRFSNEGFKLCSAYWAGLLRQGTLGTEQLGEIATRNCRPLDRRRSEVVGPTARLSRRQLFRMPKTLTHTRATALTCEDLGLRTEQVRDHSSLSREREERKP